MAPTYLATAEGWPGIYAGAHAGCLVVHGVFNPTNQADLDRRKEELQAELQTRYGEMDRGTLSALAPMAAYAAYYRKFGKSYHVLAQLESVARKKKGIPRGAALVEAMFMAELKNQILTAGHDLETLELPVVVGIAVGTERYTVLRGEERGTVAGDLMMRDGKAVISTVLHGPDRRTAIAETTRSSLFAVYGPPGVGAAALREHLQAILANVRIVCPAAEMAALVVV